MARLQIVSQGTGGIVRSGGIIASPTTPARREIVSTGTYGLLRKGKEVTTPSRTKPPPDSVVLGTGEYVAKSEFDKLTKAKQAYLKKFGIDKFNKEQERVATQRIEAISPYKEGEGYDIVKMVSAGYSAENLRQLGFDEEGIKDAQRLSSTLTQLQEYETKDGYDIYKAVAEGKVASDTLSEVFGHDIVETAQGAVRELSKYESNGGFDLGQMLQDGYATDRLEELGFSTQGIVAAQEFAAQHIKLDSGEYASREDWATLDPKAQGYIMTYGFEKGYERYNAEFEAANILLDTGEYINREEWAKLEPKAQDYVKTYGVEKYNAIIPEPSEDKGWFRNTVNYLKQALTVDESILTGEIFGIKNPKLERAAAQINKLFEVFAPQVETKLADNPKGFFAETGIVVASYMPFVWAVNWRKMSTESLIINGAIDAIIVVSLGLGSGLSKFKARPIVNAATNAGKAASKMKIALRTLAKTRMSNIAKYTKASSNAQKAIQASKVADNAFILQLSKIGKITSKQLKIVEKASGVRGLRRAILDVNKAQQKLQIAWSKTRDIKQVVAGRVNPYQTNTATIKSVATKTRNMGILDKVASATDLRAINKAGLRVITISNKKLGLTHQLIYNPAKATTRDINKLTQAWYKVFKSPGVKNQIRLGKALGYTDADIAAFLTSTATNWKTLGFTSAPWRLKDIPVKYRVSSAKYIKAMSKVANAQSQLEVALATFDSKLKPRYKFTTSPEFKGFAVEWRKKILPTFEGGQPVVAPLGRGGKGVQLAVLEKVAPKVKLRNVFQMRLKPVYKKAAEVARRVVPPTVKSASKVATAAAVAAALARKVGATTPVKPAVIAKTITKEAQRQAAKISTKAATRITAETIIKEATRQAVDIMAIGKTAAQTSAMVSLNIEAMIKALPLSETKTELQTETVVRTLTKVVTALVTKVTTKLKLRSRIRLFIPSSDGTMRRMTYAELAGSVAWKQGFIYKLIYPPYGEGNILHSRKPFPGVKTVKGAGSAYKTIIKAGGEVPKTILRDMGIMDIEIKTPKKGKPTLMFRADIKQETRQGKRRVVPKRRPVKRRLQGSATAA